MHTELIDTLAAALNKPLQENLAVTISEGAIKALFVDQLLRNGYTLIEGGSAGAKVVSFKDGVLKAHSLTIPKSKLSTGGDIRVLFPKPASIEIQCRSEIGYSDALLSKNILEDVNKVVDGQADVFVLVVDGAIFEHMLGQRDPRGRKPLNADLIPELIASSKVFNFVTDFGTTRHAIFYTNPSQNGTGAV